MGKLLSVKQFAALALGQKNPPWHLGNLCALYNQSPISLNQSIAALSAAETVVFVNAGTLAEISSSTPPLVSLASENDDPGFGVPAPDLDQRFNYYWDSLASGSLPSLADILKSNGVSISYLSPINENEPEIEEAITGGGTQGNIIGLVGTYAAFASLNVKELPPKPSTWTFDDQAVAADSSFILGGISPIVAFNLALNQTNPDQVDDDFFNSFFENNPYALPLAALFPGVSADTVGTGLLGVVKLNLGVNTKQLLVNLINNTRNTIVTLLSKLFSTPMPDSIDGVIATLNAYTDWIKSVPTINITDIPPSIDISTTAGDPLLSISQINYQVAGPPQATFSISAYTLNSDFTSSGGTVDDGA